MRYITLCILFFAAPITSAQEVTFGDLLETLVRQNREIEKAEMRAALAELRVQRVVEAAQPRLQADLSPLYGLGTRRGSDFTAIEDIAEFPPPPETTMTQSIGAGLSYRQLLPTAGSLSARLATRLDIARTEDGDSLYSLAPSVSLEASQPLFTSGDVLDFESSVLSEQAAILGRRRTETSVSATENRLVRQLASLYVQAISTRRTAELQRRQIELAEERLASAQIRADQGGGAASEVVRQEVALGGARSALLGLEAGLLDLEDQMTALLDRPVSISELSSELPTVITRAEEELATPSVTQAQLALEEARARAALARRTPGATLNMTLSLSPRYRDERESETTLSGAFSDFTGSGAGIDVQLAASVEIPVLSGGERRIASTERAIEEDLAAIDLAETQSRVERRITLLRKRRGIADRRLALLADELSYQTDLVAREAALLESDSSTEELIEAVRLQVEALRNELWEIEAEVFLIDLEVADLTTHKLADRVVY